MDWNVIAALGSLLSGSATAGLAWYGKKTLDDLKSVRVREAKNRELSFLPLVRGGGVRDELTLINTGTRSLVVIGISLKWPHENDFTNISRLLDSKMHEYKLPFGDRIVAPYEQKMIIFSDRTFLSTIRSAMDNEYTAKIRIEFYDPESQDGKISTTISLENNIYSSEFSSMKIVAFS